MPCKQGLSTWGQLPQLGEDFENLMKVPNQLAFSQGGYGEGLTMPCEPLDSTKFLKFFPKPESIYFQAEVSE